MSEHRLTAKTSATEALSAMARLSLEDLWAKFSSSASGLSVEQAETIRAQVGPNLVAREEKKTLARRFAEQAINPLNLMMASLVIVNLFWLDNVEAAVMIGAMIVLSLVLSVVQEDKSSRAAEALQAMVSTSATVVRPGEGGETHSEVPLADLVPGDVVLLSAGDMIPADVRLIAARDLFLDQASLTGESLPVEKFPTLPAQGSDDPLALANLAFMGTHVTSGSGRGFVIATGASTNFGSLAHAIVENRAHTDFEKGTAKFTWLMLLFMAVMAPAVFLINGAVKGDWAQALVFAVAVAVGLTPEMLPMIVTVNLSKGALALSKKKLIVKRLDAIQNFGAMDILCTDKTGTLTQDKVVLKRSLNLKGEPSDDVLVHAYLNSRFQTGLKNLLDIAVLEHEDLEKKLDLSKTYSLIDEVPFDFERRRLSVVLKKIEGTQERHLLICKGAVEEVLNVCTRAESGGIVFPLDETRRAAIDALKQGLNQDGFRVVAVASKTMPADQTAYHVSDEADLTLLGFVAFLDPPKDSAASALATLKGFGVGVKILTGDNDTVTRKICRDVGLSVDGVLLGAEIATLDDAALAAKAERTTIFAKVSPDQKARVIKALQSAGHVVGFMGDGINDGPALKVADVGISVDTAVDIAKESASIILLEKNLMVLGKGVIEGRRVFGNIVKYIRMGASSSFGNMLSVLGASAWLPFLPMSPVQILANGLLYDLSQTAIPTDAVDNDELAKPRRWDIKGIARFMLVMGPVSSLFDYATFALLFYVFDANGLGDTSFFQTGWFVESILSQTLIIHVIRTRKIPFMQSKPSMPLVLTSLVICAVGAFLPFSPLASALGFVPLPWIYAPCMVVIIGAYLGLAFVVKRKLLKV